MPSLAARWISAIVSRSNVADSRRPGCQPFDVAVISTPRRCRRGSCRAGAPSRSGGSRRGRRRSRPPRAARARWARCSSRISLATQSAPRPATVSADEQLRLVQRVAERLAGVAADDQAALLGHERAHVPDRAAHDDVGALERDPAPRRGVAVDHEQAAAGGGARGLAGRCPRRSPSPTSCSRRRRRRSCRARARSRAGSSRRSSSRRGLRSRPRAARRGRPRSSGGRRGAGPATRSALAGLVQPAVELAHGVDLEVEGQHRVTQVGRGHQATGAGTVAVPQL